MPERNENEPDENDRAVLADSESIRTTAIGIIGGTAQVDVSLPVLDEDDDDDDVIDGEVAGDEPVIASLATSGDDRDGADAAVDASPVDADAAHDADDVSDEPVAHEASDDAADEPESETTDGPEASDEDASDEVVEAEIDTVDAEVDVAEAPASDPEPDDAAEPVVVDAETETAEAAIADATPLGASSADVAPAADDHAARPAPATGSIVATVVPTATPITGSVPSTRREAHHAAEQVRHATERVQVARPAAPVLQSRRIGDLEPGRESADLLTAERLLDPAQIVRAEPEGRWQRLVYTVSRHRINLGDSKRARARKDLDRRISAPLAGGAKFVPVLSRKGGVGKTTVTALLGMALADARDDRVIAIDANPDRGTLADRIGRTSGKTVRDLVRSSADVVGFNDLSSIVARDETRLDVLASDTDPHVSEAFSDHDYENVAAVAAHYYSIVLTDTGTGIVHSVMGATLGLSDQIVIVAGLSVDEARLASETLTWLESNGFGEAVKNAVVVLNTSRPGTPMVRADELETHFSSRVRSVVRVPYDPHLAAGSVVTFRDLDPATREAARSLAASVVEGLRLLSSAA